MNEVVNINSFRNHDSPLYPKKKQKSISVNPIKTTVIADFNQQFNLFSPSILLYGFKIFSIITVFCMANIRYNSKFILCVIDAEKKNCSLKLTRLGSFHVFMWVILLFVRFVVTGEPAAVVGSLVREKVVERVLMQNAAAGSLCFATDLHMTNTDMFGWDEIAWMHLGKKCHSNKAAVDSCRDYFWTYTFLHDKRCVNIGEPAAGFVFPYKIKVVEKLRPESTAAGSLFCWSNETRSNYREL